MISLFLNVHHSLTCSLPLHLNKVAGIVGRADLLCALFFQLSFLTYCKAFNRGRQPKTLYVTLYSTKRFSSYVLINNLVAPNILQQHTYISILDCP